MLIKCFGGPCDGQVIDIPQENDDCRMPSSVPMPYKINDECRFVTYFLEIKYDDGWATIKYEYHRDMLKDLYVSPEAMENIRNWNFDY